MTLPKIIENNQDNKSSINYAKKAIRTIWKWIQETPCNNIFLSYQFYTWLIPSLKESMALLNQDSHKKLDSNLKAK